MNPQLLLVYGLVIVAAVMAVVAVFPAIWQVFSSSVTTVEQYQKGKVDQATKALDDIFIDVPPRWLKMAYGLGPVAVGAGVFLVSQNVLLAVGGAVVGILLPDLYVRQTRSSRKRQFRAQLVDSLFMLSSSLRAGLSLTQSFEILESEMPPPASQEFGLMMKAHQVGRTLEEAMQRLNQRMACEEMHLITTALLLARETGGDVTTIINQLITTIREKRKLNEKVGTLTLQGRLQAYIMSFLPVGFAVLVRTFNPHYFDPLLQDPTGKMLIITAVGLWLCGMVLLMKLSKVEI